MILTILLLLAILVALTTVGRVTPFLALILVALGGGLVLGLPLEAVVGSVQKGLGDMLGGTALVLVFGAILGQLVANSGAAIVITDQLVRWFGTKHLPWGLALAGLAIGIPLFYNVGFVLVIPLIFGLVSRHRLPLVRIAIPMLAALSVAHSLLPPHPSPATLVGMFHADMAATFGLGLLVSLPAIAVAGPLFSGILPPLGNSSDNRPPIEPPIEVQNPPSFALSLFSVLLPVGLLACTAGTQALNQGSGGWLQFISEPTILMLISVMLASYALGWRQGHGIPALMHQYEKAVKDIAIILLVIGASGALKQVLIDSKATASLAETFQNLGLPPLVLGWVMAAAIRVALGSATVAGLTAATIIAPMLPSLGADPNLMVLAIGAGSIFFSHVNDTGFWMYKTYFGLSLRDTFLSWTLMESIVSIMGLLGVLFLDKIINTPVLTVLSINLECHVQNFLTCCI